MTTVQILSFATSVSATEGYGAIESYNAQHATSVPLGSGSGDAHVYVVRFEAGGDIGAHVTGFGQLFIVVEGAGWVSGDDDVRVPIETGEAAFFPRGHRHAKASDTGMMAVMVQVYDLAPDGAPPPG